MSSTGSDPATTSMDPTSATSTVNVERSPSPSTSALTLSLIPLSLSSPPHPSTYSRDRDASVSLDWPSCDSPTTTTGSGGDRSLSLAAAGSDSCPQSSLDVLPPVPRSRLTSRIKVLKALLIGRGNKRRGGEREGKEGEVDEILDGSELRERLERVENELCSWVNASPSPFENNCSGGGVGGGGASSFETSSTRDARTTRTESDVGK
ncbi:hypothetical protein MVLG_03156 [Microbotryum lychnidis-dioicae p1A1 Lamole]|uniref:Uncharacterized protein n=1 Tax=Microbotryum lychnidis-dioicae (strain p1A1 Lamole / MvSl-1064) TaxID=683840 RepID=U5H7C0_USTV1|nr:hypothetical protein MVLG_03156 [Microbotryum lychnidis-dioicae p1A1 Lamole]|eukprot:KDE06504.1 hypothetical protein MVLG_03156 [Microbotryum lychnidis-dioicae p1A1 Lamole]